MKLTFDKWHLKAAAICAARNDTKGPLQGVCFSYRSTSSDRVNLVGTDEHILFVGSTPIVWKDDVLTRNFEMIIPIDVVRTVCEGNRHTITFESTPQGLYLLNDILFSAMRGSFPEYEWLIPKTASGEAGNFDAELLLRAQDSLRTYSCDQMLVPEFSQNGKGPATMSNQSIPDALVVIMPWECRKGEIQQYRLESFRPRFDA